MDTSLPFLPQSLRGALISCAAVGIAASGPHRADGQRAPATRPPPRAAVDEYVKEQMRLRRIPGVAIAVIRDGNVLFERAYGTANLETNTPVSTASSFQVASLTKQFTAAAMMLLVEEGKVGLDSSVVRYIDGAPASWLPITVRHLLTHTAGIFPGAIIRVDSAGKLTTREGVPLIDISARRTLDVMAHAPLLFQPGERAVYCDACYFLLGLVIERASGEQYSTFLQQHIFNPVGMKRSAIIDRWEIVPGLVLVYTMRDGKLAPWRRDWQYEVNAFAGIRTTTGDLARWDAALRRGAVLKPASIEAMWTPAKLNDGRDALVFGDPYGFGWTLGELRGHKTVEHAGASGTFILRVLDGGVTVIVLSNLDGPSGSQPATIARGIAGLVDSTLVPPERLSARADPSPQATEMIRQLIADLAAGHASATMTPAHQAYYGGIPLPARQEDSRLLTSLTGLSYAGGDDVAGRWLARLGDPVTKILYYHASLGVRPYAFTFWLTEDGKVAYLRFTPR